MAVVDGKTEVKNIEDLVQKVRAYNPGADTELLKRAYWFSSEAHGLQTREEGTPYMAHPLAVASILADMKMDVTTIAAAILHDTVEDTHATVEDINKRFGHEAAFLVDALTKLSRMEFTSKEMAQAESFRKMLLSMAEDVRVILIKFADRLHNMRTLEFLPEHKRQRIAQETIEIYAPLANRLGIGWLKTELEDMSFRYLMPALFEEITKKISLQQAERESYVKDITRTVEEKLAEEGIPGKVTGRVKHAYGIYQKMLRQAVPFEQIHDVFGLRVITDAKPNCYAVLGLIHSLYKPVEGKFKDYIGMPKFNLYQSLHTTVIGPGGERVEFQIRTEDMHRIAEEGIAAHWRYKDKAARKKDERYIAWLREIVAAHKEEPDAKAFMETLKAEVLPDVIYVFTPKGDIKELPRDSTPIDFAYSIHTEVGHKCIGARINGRMVPLRHRLESGNTVELITSATQHPSRDWLKFAVTSKAKARIKQWLKTEERKQSIALGTKLMEAEFRKHHIDLKHMKAKELEKAAASFNFQSPDDLLVAIGFGKVSPVQVINRLFPEQAHIEEPPKPKAAAKEQEGITVKGVEGILYHTARCCFPVPGDRLVGFITRGKGVSVHRSDCPNLEMLAVDEARMITVNWEAPKEALSQARLGVDTLDKPGVMANMSASISAAGVNISHLEANTTQEGNAHIVLTLEVKDRSQLTLIMQKIAQTDGVLRVRRY